MTLPVNVTNVKRISKAKGISFYHLMVWICTKSINSITAFKMRIREGKLYELDNIELHIDGSRFGYL